MTWIYAKLSKCGLLWCWNRPHRRPKWLSNAPDSPILWQHVVKCDDPRDVAWQAAANKPCKELTLHKIMASVLFIAYRLMWYLVMFIQTNREQFFVAELLAVVVQIPMILKWLSPALHQTTVWLFWFYWHWNWPNRKLNLWFNCNTKR